MGKRSMRVFVLLFRPDDPRGVTLLKKLCDSIGIEFIYTIVREEYSWRAEKLDGHTVRYTGFPTKFDIVYRSGASSCLDYRLRATLAYTGQLLTQDWFL